MKIEAGRFYRTRDGRKAYVAAIGNPLNAKDLYPAIGFMEGEHGLEGTWTTCGRYMDKREDHDSDLIAEWREPESMSMDLYLVKTSCGKVTTIHLTPDVPGWTVIGKKTATITEGEGMTDQPGDAT